MTIRREQATETRRNLLDAAQKLFAENGYDATSVRSVNYRAKVADGLLYHYFPGGKKEILQVLVIEKIEQIKPRLLAIAELLDELPLEEAIEQIFQKWFELFKEYKDVIKILLKENEIMQIVEREQFAQIVCADEKWLSKFLKKRALKGEIKEMDYDSAAVVLKTIIFSYCLSMLTGIGAGFLNDKEQRKKLLAYQVGLWKTPQP
ncbi:MAG: TetR/AcrR family transcriptional regulator [Oscillospiraceae bacterium]|nr:TetR/AcrR family transcriptional regulator [Oscillospiraceae bacterium]